MHDLRRFKFFWLYEDQVNHVNLRHLRTIQLSATDSVLAAGGAALVGGDPLVV